MLENNPFEFSRRLNNLPFPNREGKGYASQGKGYPSLYPESALIKRNSSCHSSEGALDHASPQASTRAPSAGAPIMDGRGEDPSHNASRTKIDLTLSTTDSASIVSHRHAFYIIFLTWEKIRCWLPVIICLLFSMPGGSMHCFGNITIYIASYLRIHADEAIRYSDVQWIYAVQAIMQGIATPLGGKLEAYVGVRLAALASSLTLCLSLIFSYFATSYNLLLLTYGVLFGIGNGLLYVLPLSLALKWQPEHKGVVTGLYFFARGVILSFVSPWQTWYVNPLNKTPTYFPFHSNEQYYVEESILQNVPYVFLWMGIGFAVLQLFCLFFMHDPKQNDMDMPKNNIPDRLQEITLPKNNLTLTIFQILTYQQFWVLWLILFCNWQSVCFVNGYWKIIGQVDFGITDSSLAYLGGLVAIVNSMSRIVWGRAMDLCGFRASMSLFCFGFSGFLCIIPICKQLGSTVMMISYHITLYFLKILDAGAFTIVAPEVSNIFGENNFSTVFGLLYTARAVGTAVSAIIITSLYDRIGGVGLCLAMASFTVFAGIINLSMILKPLPSGEESSKGKYLRNDKT
ncbi:transporter, major facilitator family protein, partial [Cardiosporidium cionae]